MEVVIPMLTLDKIEEDKMVYRSTVMVPAVEAFVKHIKNNGGAIPGECHPVPAETRIFLNMATVSHAVTEVWVDGSTVYVKLVMAGKYHDLAKAGVRWHGKFRMATEGIPEITSCKIHTVDLLYRDDDDEWRD